VTEDEGVWEVKQTNLAKFRKGFSQVGDWTAIGEFQELFEIHIEIIEGDDVVLLHFGQQHILQQGEERENEMRAKVSEEKKTSSTNHEELRNMFARSEVNSLANRVRHKHHRYKGRFEVPNQI
jgi:hypothetical protein